MYHRLEEFNDSPTASVTKMPIASWTSSIVLVRIVHRWRKHLNEPCDVPSATNKATWNLWSHFTTTGSTSLSVCLVPFGASCVIQKIGATGQASIQTVGPDIARADRYRSGFTAAIPAVIAYNFINRQIQIQRKEWKICSDFLNIVKRSNMGR